MGTGFSKKKKQAKQLQNQLKEMQSRIQLTEVVGSAGNGLITLTLSGEHELKSLDIKRECVDPDDIEGLILLFKAAYADALSKLKEQSMGNIPEGLSGGLPPGLSNLSGFGF